jgi:protein-S-isoprenylcysteine O-methyltransferase Ste14
LKYNLAEGRAANMTQVDGERGARVRFPPPLVYLISILLGVGMRYTAGPLAVPAYRYLALTAGVAILLGGLWLIVGAWKLFKRTGQDPKPWKPTPEIVSSGPYRFTRNPMYLGLTCIQIGVGLALNNLWISLLAAFSLLAVHFIAVLPEENYLTEKFGDSYRGYLVKVRRYL